MNVETRNASAAQIIRNSAMAFLDGEHTFAWITGVLLHSRLPKQEIAKLLLPLRHRGDGFRAAALFGWLERREW